MTATNTSIRVCCYKLYTEELVGRIVSTTNMDDDDDDYSSLSASHVRGFTEEEALLESTRLRIAQCHEEERTHKASRSSVSVASGTTTATGGTGSRAPNNDEEEEDEEPAKKKPKKKSKPKELPPELQAFKYEFCHRMVIGKEINPNDKENPGPYRVAQTVTVGKEGNANCKVFELAKLMSHQLRKMAINFGVKGGDAKTKFDCRRALAGRVDMGTAYDSTCSPASTAKEKKINTLLRIVNCCFLPRFRERFLELNDQINQAKFESEGGPTANPIKEFWTEVSSTVNDPEAEEELSVVLYSGENEDAYIYKMVTDGHVDLKAFNVGTWLACRQHMSVRDVRFRL